MLLVTTLNHFVIFQLEKLTGLTLRDIVILDAQCPLLEDVRGHRIVILILGGAINKARLVFRWLLELHIVSNE